MIGPPSSIHPHNKAARIPVSVLEGRIYEFAD